MMLYPPVQDLLKNVDNRYLLVNVVARRARQISLEAESRGEILIEKPISIAVHEVARGELTAYVKNEE
ncbi:MAG: DNA-directed RNA polymerase subunit omega [Oscillospiraceae bacterium]|nr:DNA-directed RNA polymerase subunit omega [Oscillospiraceae bacterium]